METAAFSGCSKLTREDGLVVVNGAFFDIDWKKHERYRQSLDFLPEPPEDDGFFQDIVYLPEDVKQIQSSITTTERNWQTNLACQILIGEHYTDTSVPSYSLNVSRPSGWTKTLSITSSHSRSSKYSSG